MATGDGAKALRNAKHEAFARALAAGAPCFRPSRFYCYALVDPRDGKPFYVGKGKGNRYARHFADWRLGRIGNAAKHDRISAIVSAGHEPVAILIEDGLDEHAALGAEADLILFVGRENLTNLTRGKDTPLRRSMAQAKAILAKFKPFGAYMAERPRAEWERRLFKMIRVELRRVARHGAPSTIIISAQGVEVE